jgi:peroxiredoxin
MRITLDNVTNIVLIVSCFVVVGYTLYNRDNAGKSAPAYIAGSLIQDPCSLGLKTAKRTLILATSSSCRFCVASLPFYRKLVPAAKSHGVRIVAVTPELPATNRAFLEDNQVSVDAALSVRQSRLSLGMTPLLILVRKDGTVVGSWEGKLSGRMEKQVLKIVEGS